MTIKNSGLTEDEEKELSEALNDEEDDRDNESLLVKFAYGLLIVVFILGAATYLWLHG